MQVERALHKQICETADDVSANTSEVPYVFNRVNYSEERVATTSWKLVSALRTRSSLVSCEVRVVRINSLLGRQHY